MGGCTSAESQYQYYQNTLYCPIYANTNIIRLLTSNNDLIFTTYLFQPMDDTLGHRVTNEGILSYFRPYESSKTGTEYSMPRIAPYPIEFAQVSVDDDDFLMAICPPVDSGFIDGQYKFPNTVHSDHKHFHKRLFPIDLPGHIEDIPTDLTTVDKHSTKYLRLVKFVPTTRLRFANQITTPRVVEPFGFVVLVIDLSDEFSRLKFTKFIRDVISLRLDGCIVDISNLPIFFFYYDSGKTNKDDNNDDDDDQNGGGNNIFVDGTLDLAGVPREDTRTLEHRIRTQYKSNPQLHEKKPKLSHRVSSDGSNHNNNTNNSNAHNNDNPDNGFGKTGTEHVYPYINFAEFNKGYNSKSSFISFTRGIHSDTDIDVDGLCTEDEMSVSSLSSSSSSSASSSPSPSHRSWLRPLPKIIDLDVHSNQSFEEYAKEIGVDTKLLTKVVTNLNVDFHTTRYTPEEMVDILVGYGFVRNKIIARPIEDPIKRDRTKSSQYTNSNKSSTSTVSATPPLSTPNTNSQNSDQHSQGVQMAETHTASSPSTLEQTQSESPTHQQQQNDHVDHGQPAQDITLPSMGSVIRNKLIFVLPHTNPTLHKPTPSRPTVAESVLNNYPHALYNKQLQPFPYAPLLPHEYIAYKSMFSIPSHHYSATVFLGRGHGGSSVIVDEDGHCVDVEDLPPKRLRQRRGKRSRKAAAAAPTQQPTDKTAQTKPLDAEGKASTRKGGVKFAGGDGEDFGPDDDDDDNGDDDDVGADDEIPNGENNTTTGDKQQGAKKIELGFSSDPELCLALGKLFPHSRLLRTSLTASAESSRTIVLDNFGEMSDNNTNNNHHNTHNNHNNNNNNHSTTTKSSSLPPPPLSTTVTNVPNQKIVHSNCRPIQSIPELPPEATYKAELGYVRHSIRDGVYDCQFDSFLQQYHLFGLNIFPHLYQPQVEDIRTEGYVKGLVDWAFSVLLPRFSEYKKFNVKPKLIGDSIPRRSYLVSTFLTEYPVYVIFVLYIPPALRITNEKKDQDKNTSTNNNATADPANADNTNNNNASPQDPSELSPPQPQPLTYKESILFKNKKNVNYYETINLATGQPKGPHDVGSLTITPQQYRSPAPAPTPAELRLQQLQRQTSNPLRSTQNSNRSSGVYDAHGNLINSDAKSFDQLVKERYSKYCIANMANAESQPQNRNGDRIHESSHIDHFNSYWTFLAVFPHQLEETVKWVERDSLRRRLSMIWKRGVDCE